MCMVSCVGYATKIAKGKRTRGKSVGFSEYTQNKQLIIHVVVASFYLFFNNSASKLAFASE